MAEHFDWLSGFVLPYVNFFIFLGILVYFARKPLTASLLGKRKSFEDLLLKANAAKDEATKKAADLDRRLSELDRQLEAHRAAIIESARLEAEKILADGRAQAEFLKEEAMRAAAGEAEHLKEQLRNEILSAVKDSVVTRVKSQGAGQKQSAFVDLRVKDIEKNLKIS